MKKFIVRVDDVGWGYNKRIDYLMSDYQKFHDLLVQRQIPYCPCIIPAICDPTMLSWMRDNFRVLATPCLHGWDHEPNGNPDDEFANRTRESIKQRISLGIDKLTQAGIEVFGMSAPFNRYDDKVVDSCRELGLKFFLAGYGREKVEVYHNSPSFKIYPAHARLYVRGGSNYDSYIKEIETLPDNSYPYVITLHCTWEYPNLKNKSFLKFLDCVSDIGTIDLYSEWAFY